MRNDEAMFYVALLLVALAVVNSFIEQRRVKTLMGRWLRKGGYRLVSSYRISDFDNSAPLLSLRGMPAYQVVVLDKKGRERRCWMRFGSWFWGLASSRIQVEWDVSSRPDRGEIGGERCDEIAENRHHRRR